MGKGGARVPGSRAPAPGDPKIQRDPLAFSYPGANGAAMTREQVVSAVARRLPFVLRMADGREYPVPHPDYISLPPKSAYVIVYDDIGNFSVLPLLTMTGLRSTISDGSTKTE